MRRRRRFVDRAGACRAPPTDADVAAVVVAFVVAAAVASAAAATQTATAAEQAAWRTTTTTTTSNHSVMHNVSTMIERLLDNYDMRFRPQFGGRLDNNNSQLHARRSLSTVGGHTVANQPPPPLLSSSHLPLFFPPSLRNGVSSHSRCGTVMN